MRGEMDSLNLQVPKVRRRLAPIPHNTDLNLRHDKPVATSMLAHAFMQMRQPSQILDFFMVALDAHAAVPAVEGLDQPDDAAVRFAVHERGGVVGVVADEMRLRTYPTGWAHDEVPRALGEG